MDKNMIIRLGVLLFTLTNLILTACGVNPLPISEDLVYEILSILFVIVASAWNAWKNNNFSPAAKTAQKVLDAIKSGKLSSDQIERLLTE